MDWRLLRAEAGRFVAGVAALSVLHMVILILAAGVPAGRAGWVINWAGSASSAGMLYLAWRCFRRVQAKEGAAQGGVSVTLGLAGLLVLSILFLFALFALQGISKGGR